MEADAVACRLAVAERHDRQAGGGRIAGRPGEERRPERVGDERHAVVVRRGRLQLGRGGGREVRAQAFVDERAVRRRIRVERNLYAA